MTLSEVKRHLNKQVLYKNTVYELKSCILRKREKEFYYLAELKDINANSVLSCKLENVKPIERSN